MSENVIVRNQRRGAVGLVTSDKMEKTIKVTIKRQVKHPIYEKRINRKTVYIAHDENNDARKGDVVEIAETRKHSKTKCWRLVKIIRRAE